MRNKKVCGLINIILTGYKSSIEMNEPYKVFSTAGTTTHTLCAPDTLNILDF